MEVLIAHVWTNDPIEHEHQKQSVATRYHTEVQKSEEAFADWGVNTSDFGQNDAEIKKMTKHQDLKNEVKKILEAEEQFFSSLILLTAEETKKSTPRNSEPGAKLYQW